MMEDFLQILILIFFLWIIWLIIHVPVYIARNRGISGGELTTITILSWCGLIFLITWFVALGLALFWDNHKWASHKPKESELDRLEKAHNLMERGVITKKEYEKMKKELI